MRRALGQWIVCLALVGCTVWVASVVEAGTILFVTYPDPIEGGDIAIRDHMTNDLGHTVTVINQDSPGLVAATAGKDLIVVSESCWSSEVETPFTNVAVPLIMCEPCAWDGIGITPANPDWSINDEVDIDIVATGHPLAAGLTGTVTVFSDAPSHLSYANDYAPGGTVIAARTADLAYAAIIYYDTGDLLQGNVPAPAPRLAFFMGNDGATSNMAATNLSAGGLALFDAAVSHMIPEPTTLGLLAVGFAIVSVRRRR